jgi:hypothetical protein
LNEEETPRKLDGTPVEEIRLDRPPGHEVTLGAETDLDHTEVDEYLSGELTERQLLRLRRGAALEERSKATAWLMTVGFGPAAIIAVLLVLMVDGSANLAWGMAGLGLMMLLLKIYRADRKVREIEEEMEDPMDGS